MKRGRSTENSFQTNCRFIYSKLTARFMFGLPYTSLARKALSIRFRYLLQNSTQQEDKFYRVSRSWDSLILGVLKNTIVWLLKRITFPCKEISTGFQMKQLYKFLLSFVSRSINVVPMVSGKKKKESNWSSLLSTMAYIGLQVGSVRLKRPTLRNTCSVSPHLRKAEKDCKRAQIYWPPTVATQYQIFWATVSPGPSRPVLTAWKVPQKNEMLRWA